MSKCQIGKERNFERKMALNRKDTTNSTCRVCLGLFSTTELFSIYNDSCPSTSDMLIQLLPECDNDPDEKLPRNVCSQCLELIRNAFSIVQGARRSHRILMERYGINADINEPLKDRRLPAMTTEVGIQTEYTRSPICQCRDQKRPAQRRAEMQEDKAGTLCPVCCCEFTSIIQMQQHLQTIHKQTSHFSEGDCFLEEPEIDIHSSTRNPTKGTSVHDIKITNLPILEEQLAKQTSNHHHNNKDEGSLELGFDGQDISQYVTIKLETDDIKKDITEWDAKEKTVSEDEFELVTGESMKLEEGGAYDDTFESDAADPVQVNTLDEKPDNNGKNCVNTCPECSRSFSRRCHLLRHMLIHQQQKAHLCKVCSKRFTRSDHLKKHMMNVHGKDLKCEVCGWTCARLDTLDRHKRSHHNISIPTEREQTLRTHRCECCDKSFVSKSYLRKHISLHENRVFTCSHCSITFKERKLLREHEKTHQEDKHYLCCICGESFARKDYLTVHMRRHNGEKPYKCKYCAKAFPRATDLNIHERYHTGKKPNLCTLCGKSFHRAYNLTIHMRTHSGERPFKCDRCPKAFTQSNDLKAHIRRHTGERFKCTHCEAAFLQLYALRQHSLNIHGIHIESSTGRLQRDPVVRTVLDPAPFPTSHGEKDVQVQP